MSTLVTLGLGFAVGLIVGWNVLPQPAWIQKLYTKATD